MLQVHPDKVDLWISAARFEMDKPAASSAAAVEVGMQTENARTILMEAIRFHPKSKELYLESFCLELVFATSLAKDPSKYMVPEETIDQVKEGKIAQTVYEKGLEEACLDDQQAKIEFSQLCLKNALQLSAPYSVIKCITG